MKTNINSAILAFAVLAGASEGQAQADTVWHDFEGGVSLLHVSGRLNHIDANQVKAVFRSEEIGGMEIIEVNSQF